MWKRSNLRKGDRVKVQESIFVTSSQRFIKAIYEGETKFGILLRFFFEPGPCTEEPTWNYKYFVSWSSLYCGDIKLQTESGDAIRAERIFV